MKRLRKKRFSRLLNSKQYFTLLILLAVNMGTVHACAFHAIPPNRSTQQIYQDTIVEKIAASTASKISSARKKGITGSNTKNNHMVVFLFTKKLNTYSEQLINFNYKQAIKGHYTRFQVTDKINVVEAKDRYSSDPLLITEMDVLMALTKGDISWLEAKRQGLISITGSAYKPQIKLNKALSTIFP